MASGMMLALTLWRPWDTAILRLGKPVENRNWPPPLHLVGHRFALHCGKKFDEEGACAIVKLAHGAGVPMRTIEEHLSRAETIDSAIIGTVKLARVIRRIREEELPPSQMGFAGAVALSLSRDPLQSSPWFFGAFGWVCEEPFVLPEPVPCRGAQKLWKLPTDVEARVLAQEASR
jgi:hypothetical protein